MFGVLGAELGRGRCCGIVGENWGWGIRGLIPLRVIVPTLVISKSKFKMSLVEKMSLIKN